MIGQIHGPITTRFRALLLRKAKVCTSKANFRIPIILEALFKTLIVKVVGTKSLPSILTSLPIRAVGSVSYIVASKHSNESSTCITDNGLAMLHAAVFGDNQHLEGILQITLAYPYLHHGHHSMDKF